MTQEQPEAISQLWQALGQWTASIARPDAELAPPQYLLDAVAAATDTTIPPLPEPEDFFHGTALYTADQMTARDQVWAARVAALEKDAQRYKEGLEWILRNPGASKENIQFLAKKVLGEAMKESRDA